MSYVTSSQYVDVYRKILELSERFKMLKMVTTNVMFEFSSPLKENPGTQGFVGKEAFRALIVRYNEINTEMNRFEKRVEQIK